MRHFIKVEDLVFLSIVLKHIYNKQKKVAFEATLNKHEDIKRESIK